MMRLPPFRHIASRSAEEAARILAEHGPDAVAVAGGTDLYPNMKRRQMEPRVVVGLRGIESMQGISGGPEGDVEIGALATLAEVHASSLLQSVFPSLARAAGLVSSPPLRNMGTIGGNLCIDTRCNYYNQTYEWRAAIQFCMKKDGETCWVAPGSSRCWAVSSSDTAPVFVALGAEVTLAGPRGERRIAVERLYKSDGIQYLAKRPEEILTRIHLPPPTGWRSAYWKLRRRGSIDFPILGVAAAVKTSGDGTVEDARVVLTGVGSAPVVAHQTQSVLVGRKLAADVIREAAEVAYRSARPLDNTDLTHAYRKKMARTYVARALEELARPPC